MNRVEPEDSRLRLRVELGKAESQPLAAPLRGAAHDDPRRGLSVAVREPLVDALPQLGKADEVGVRVEHDDPERRLQQEPFEDRPERVGLAGAGLPAEEGMPVEATGRERERNALDQRQLADGERRAAGLHPLDPGGDRVGRRGVDGCVVKRA